MTDLEVMKVIDSDGKEVEIKVITVLKKTDEDKSFILYTFDAEADEVDIYASIIKEEPDNISLEAITNQEDWELVQKAIDELSN